MSKKLIVLGIMILTLFGLASCTSEADVFSEAFPKNDSYYQIFVRSFADSDGDGIGDFNGIAAKLDYLADLGISGLWLMIGRIIMR